ncbi:hypothetical protein [Siminovitchia sp. 179-K 8D1 HS]|uniref:hypothetical protein n=1 Tax=Siminovitchia sp. 179-K 8D1 HS TaxID=3142385 RepID=UPI0039A04BAF
MAKKERLNEEAAPNNNMSYADIQRSLNYETAEQLSDDGERNKLAKRRGLTKG